MLKTPSLYDNEDTHTTPRTYLSISSTSLSQRHDRDNRPSGSPSSIYSAEPKHRHAQQISSTRRDGPLTFRFSRALAPPRRRRKPRDPDRDDTDASNVGTRLLTRLMGGIRGDPFNAFPIEPKDCVPQAVDYFVQTYIPERVLRPFQGVPGIEQMAQSYFQLVISDVGMFEAAVATAEANHVISKGVFTPTKEILHHQGQALMHLQRRLADPVKRIEDLTFHIIISIMGTHFFFGELKQHQAHLAGLWSLIEMRGGIDTLGWNGSLKQAIETITSFVQYQTKVETPAATPDSTTTATDGPALEYPTHPFSPELSETIAKLPSGFSNMALKRSLSVQTIDLLLETHEQDQAHRDAPVDQPISFRRRLYTADKALQLLKYPNTPDLERMVIGGLLAYIVQSQPFESRTTVYDEPLKNFLAELSIYTFANFEHPVLLWVVLCFAAIQVQITRGSRVDFFHHTILRFKQSVKWKHVEKDMKEFLWIDERVAEWKWAWEDALGSHKPHGYSASSNSGSRGPSGSPESETTGVTTVMTPFLIEEEARQAKAEFVEMDFYGKMED